MEEIYNILNDDEFILELVKVSIDKPVDVNDDFKTKYDIVFNSNDISNKEQSEISEYYKDRLYDIFINNIDILKKFIKARNNIDVFLDDLFKKYSRLWDDEELVYLVLRHINKDFYMPEEVFNKYLSDDPYKFIKEYKISYNRRELIPKYLNKIEYIKQFIKYHNIDFIYSIPTILYDISTEDFIEILDYDSSLIVYMQLDNYDKAMHAIKNYGNYHRLTSDCCNFIDLKMVKEAVKRGLRLENVNYFIVCNYDIALYFIKKGDIEAFNYYISVLQNNVNHEEITKLLLEVCKECKKRTLKFSYPKYVLYHYDLVKLVIENYSPYVIDYFIHVCIYEPSRVDKKVDLELFELALQNGYNQAGNFCRHCLNYEYVSLALDYGFTEYFEVLASSYEKDIIDDKLILKSNYLKKDSPYTKRLNEMRYEIQDTIDGKRELSDELKSISTDPYCLSIMAGINKFYLDLYEDIYQYKYIELIVRHSQNIGYENNYIDIFARKCEEGLVKGKLLDEELFSLALTKNYIITPNSPNYIKLNPKFISLALQKGYSECFTLYYQNGGLITDELVYLALSNGFIITDNCPKEIISNRDYIMYSIVLGNINALGIYYGATNNIDDELIRSAINNGYIIDGTSPDIIKSNIEYIKLRILYLGDSLLNKRLINNTMSLYASYVRTHPNDNLPSITELYDVFLECAPNNDNYLEDVSVIPSYENCEYLLKNGCLMALETYRRYSKINSNCKPIDMHLYLIYMLVTNNLDDFYLKFKPENRDKILTIIFIIKSLKNSNVFKIDNIDEYFNKEGYTDKLIELLKEYDYSKYDALLFNLRHNDILLKNGIPNMLYNIFIPYMKEYLGLSNDKINLFKNIDTDILLFLKNKNIANFINLEIKEIDKIIELFKCENFRLTEFNDKIYDALKQEQFTHDYPIYKDIFVRFRNSIRLNNIKELERLKYLVNTILPEVSYEEIDSYIEKGRNNNLSELHNLCDRFIRKAREVYRYESNNLTNDIELPYEYDENDTLKKTALYLLENTNWIFLVNTDITLEEYANLKRIILDKDVTREEKQKHGKEISKLYKVLYEYIEENEEYIDVKEINRLKPIKRNYYIEEKNSISVFSQIAKMDIDMLLNIINNEDIYNNLNKYLKYYKIMMLPDSINKFLKDKLDIDENCNYSDISRYIMNYPIFLDSEIRKQNSFSEYLVDYNNVKINFINLLKYYISINTEIPEIRRLLCKEDYSLIDKDPSPNNTFENKEVRLERVAQLLPSLFNNSSVTIPSFDKNISINNKVINVIVGNRTNTCNLTHGERTGACMRVCGAGDTLFNFCIVNPNGFHIRFEEPYTHEYISRVSGFRNGNTVFFNQLRYSSNKDKYTNIELSLYMKKVAQELIDLTKDSECPIENVIISRDFAMDNSHFKLSYINKTNFLEGLPYFYTDVTSDNSVVLATTMKPYVPFNFDKTNIPSYKPVRDKVYGIEIGIDKLIELINSKYSIKLLLNNEDYTYIDDLEDIIDGYVGTDFYLYIDSDYNIHYDYFDMDNYHDEDVSLEEMNKYKEILMNKYNMSEKRY